MTTLFNVDAALEDDNSSETEFSYDDLLQKYKDNEGIVKALNHAQRHISRLEFEREEQRKDLDARLKLEELVSKLGSTNGADNQRTQTADEGRSNENSNANNEADFNKIFEDAFNRKQTELTRQANLREVEDALKKAWGSDYQTKLRKAVNDLGVSPELIDDVAARSPKAALNLLVGNQTTRQPIDVSPPPTRMNSFGTTESSSEANRLREYYKKLRVDNPKLYWSAKTQMEMHNLALAGKLPIE